MTATHHADSLAEMMRIPLPDQPIDWHLRLIDDDVGGGKQTPSALETIANFPAATALTVSGLDQHGFEFLVERYGTQFTALHLWKCPRIVDLSPLEHLPQLRYAAFYWNQKSVRLWNLRRTPNLRGLHFRDFNQLRRLDDLTLGASLRELGFGRAFVGRCEVESLEPLADLVQLESLDFIVNRILDGRIQPLASLRNLSVLNFPSNLFDSEQLCWLRAHMPLSLRSAVLCATRRLDQPLADGSKRLDVLVNGRRKPFLDSTLDHDRIRKYTESFDVAVEYFMANPDREPPMSGGVRKSTPR